MESEVFKSKMKFQVLKKDLVFCQTVLQENE